MIYIIYTNNQHIMYEQNIDNNEITQPTMKQHFLLSDRSNINNKYMKYNRLKEYKIRYSAYSFILIIILNISHILIHLLFLLFMNTSNMIDIKIITNYFTVLCHLLIMLCIIMLLYINVDIFHINKIFLILYAIFINIISITLPIILIHFVYNNHSVQTSLKKIFNIIYLYTSLNSGERLFLGLFILITTILIWLIIIPVFFIKLLLYLQYHYFII